MRPFQDRLAPVATLFLCPAKSEIHTFLVEFELVVGRAPVLAHLVDAAELLRDDPRILIACVGDGPERAELAADVARRGLTNIRFHGAFAKDRMPELVRSCDLGLAVLQDNPTFRTVYPNKVFDYMACEKATVLAIDGVAREMVCHQARAGVFVRPGCGADMAQTLRELSQAPLQLSEMGRNGAAWVKANVRREALAGQYAEKLQALVAEHRR